MFAKITVYSQKNFPHISHSPRILEPRQLVVRQPVPRLHHRAAYVDAAAQRIRQVGGQGVVVENARHWPDAVGLRVVHDGERRAARAAHMALAVTRGAHERELSVSCPFEAGRPNWHPCLADRAREPATEVAVAVLHLKLVAARRFECARAAGATAAQDPRRDLMAVLSAGWQCCPPGGALLNSERAEAGLPGERECRWNRRVLDAPERQVRAAIGLSLRTKDALALAATETLERAFEACARALEMQRSSAIGGTGQGRRKAFDLHERGEGGRMEATAMSTVTSEGPRRRRDVHGTGQGSALAADTQRYEGGNGVLWRGQEWRAEARVEDTREHRCGRARGQGGRVR